MKWVEVVAVRFFDLHVLDCRGSRRGLGGSAATVARRRVER